VPETKLTDQEECALCGSRKESMTGMFSGKDAIGIISVNDWYIMDLKIKSGNEKGNMPEDTEGKNTTRTTVGKNGRVLERRLWRGQSTFHGKGIADFVSVLSGKAV